MIKPGDKVRILNVDALLNAARFNDYEVIKHKDGYEILTRNVGFTTDMNKFCGMDAYITHVYEFRGNFLLSISLNYLFEEWMIYGNI